MPSATTSETSPRLALSYREVADLLGVHPLTVRRAVELGQLPVVEIGRRRLVPKRALDELLASPARSKELAR